MNISVNVIMRKNFLSRKNFEETKICSPVRKLNITETIGEVMCYLSSWSSEIIARVHI